MSVFAGQNRAFRVDPKIFGSFRCTNRRATKSATSLQLFGDGNSVQACRVLELYCLLYTPPPIKKQNPVCMMVLHPSWGPANRAGWPPIFAPLGAPGARRWKEHFCVPGESPGHLGQKVSCSTRPSTLVRKIRKKGPFFSTPMRGKPLLKNPESVSNFV